MNQIQIQDEFITSMVNAAGKANFSDELFNGIHAGRARLAKLGLDENQARTAMYDAVDIGYLNIQCEKGLTPQDCIADGE